MAGFIPAIHVAVRRYAAFSVRARSTSGLR